MSRKPVIPTVQCSWIMDETTGRRCKLPAKPGTTVCHKHGSRAPRTNAKAERMETLATLIQNDPRHPWEVVINATHIADSLMREYEAPLQHGEQLSADQISRLVDAAKLAHHLAKTAIDSNAHEHIADTYRRNVELEGEIISTVVGDVVGKLVDGLGFNPAHAAEVADWALQAASTRLAAGPDGSADVIPDPPVPRLAITSGTTNHKRDDLAPEEDSGPEADRIVDAELVDDEPRAPARTRTRPARRRKGGLWPV